MKAARAQHRRLLKVVMYAGSGSWDGLVHSHEVADLGT